MTTELVKPLDNGRGAGMLRHLSRLRSMTGRLRLSVVLIEVDRDAVHAEASAVELLGPSSKTCPKCE